MKQYHVNPKTGETGVCSAVRKCPFGGAKEHHPTETAARAAYEQSMKTHEVRTHTAGRPRSKTSSVKVSDIMDTNQLNTMVKQNYITVSAHPDDPSLKVLTYSKSAQAAGKWNPATKQARGLILKSEESDFSDATVVERPWQKFFTLEQIQGEDGEKGWALGDEEDGPTNSQTVNELDKLDFTAPAEVTDKMDGSLGVLYRAPDGKLSIATKGSFSSDQAVYYTRALRENETVYQAAEAMKTKNPDTTFLFELVGKENPIVLDYEKDDIVFLGAVEKETGVYRSTSDYSDWDESKGLTRAETMEANNLSEALALPDRENKEGVVVRLKTEDPERQMQVKIKQKDYLALHRILSSVSKTKTREILRDASLNATMDTLYSIGKTGDVTRLPEVKETLGKFEEGTSSLHARLHKEQLDHFETALLPKARALKAAKDRVDGLPDSMFEGQHGVAMKSFAASVKDEDQFTQAQLFNFFRSRLTRQPIGASAAKKIMKTMIRDL